MGHATLAVSIHRKGDENAAETILRTVPDDVLETITDEGARKYVMSHKDEFGLRITPTLVELGGVVMPTTDLDKVRAQIHSHSVD